MPLIRTSLSLMEARRIALAAQNLHRPSPDSAAAAHVTPRGIARDIARRGLVQIDSVNVLARAHLMPTYSRRGSYDVGSLSKAAGQAPRTLVEAWAHEASVIPVETYPLLAWRRRRYQEQALGSISSVVHTHPQVIELVEAIIRSQGPLTATAVQELIAHEYPREPGDHWGWNWSVAKRCLEWLFFVGRLAVAGRTDTFERLYDAPERVLPAFTEPDDATCVRELLGIGARAHGVGTVRCFQDYFRLTGPLVAQAMRDLVDEGVLHPVDVDGWRRQVFIHRDAVLPRSTQAATLLSPFDPLVWERRRLEELFGVTYRIEIYTPAHRRVHGYYVLPFLLGDRIAARLDLKHDRASGRLLVRNAFFEAEAQLGAAGTSSSRPVERATLGTDAARATSGMVTHAVAVELARMAGWLGTGEVSVELGARGALATALRGERATL